MRAFLRTVSSPLRRANSSQPDPRHASKSGGDVADFVTVWAEIQALIAAVEKPSTPSNKVVARLDALSAKLDLLIDILTSEAAGASAYETGPCLEYAIVENVFGRLVEYALADEPLGSLSLILRVFDSLAATLGYSFLAIGHRSVNALIRGCSPSSGLTPPFTPHTLSALPSSSDSGTNSTHRFERRGLRTPPREGHTHRIEPTHTPSYAGSTGQERHLRCPLDLSALLYTLSARIKECPSLLSLFLLRVRARRTQLCKTPLSNQNLSQTDDPFLLSTPASTPSRVVAIQSEHDTVRSGRDSVACDNLAKAANATLSKDLSSGSSSSDESFVYERHNVQSSSSKPSHRMVFPLFTTLMSMMHREGRVGESARGALLLLIGLAYGQLARGRQPFGLHKHIAILRKYVATSGFADVLAAAIGAIYASLPRKLCYIQPGGLSLVQDEAAANIRAETSNRCKLLGIVTSRDTMYKRNSALLVSMLAFSSTVCIALQPEAAEEESGSHAVLENMLDAFSVAVMENAIQSDIGILMELMHDTVTPDLELDDLALFTALATKLSLMLGALPSSDSLGRLLATWLMDDAGLHTGGMDGSSKRSAALPLAELFSLAMRAMPSGDSKHFQASMTESWLHLLHILLTHHGTITLGLLGGVPDLQATSYPYRLPASAGVSKDDRTFVYSTSSVDSDSDDSFDYPRIDDSVTRIFDLSPAQKNNALVLMYLAGARRRSTMGPDDKDADSFLMYLQHAEQRLALEMFPRKAHDVIRDDGHEPLMHRLSTRSHSLQAIARILRNFFGNTPNLNLVLLQCITAIAICPYRSLLGWLVPEGVAILSYMQNHNLLSEEILKPLQLTIPKSVSLENHDSQGDCLVAIILQLLQYVNDLQLITPRLEYQLEERKSSLALVDGILSAVTTVQTPTTSPKKPKFQHMSSGATNADFASCKVDKLDLHRDVESGHPSDITTQTVRNDLLDNILILRAFVKEIVSVVIVRAIHGVDGI